jgi:homoserine dehydrogenase
MELKLAFIGFGNVAREFALLLKSRADLLAENYNLTCRATAIATARHGCVLSTNINLDEAIGCVRRKENLAQISGATAAADPMAVIENCDADIIFETTPLDPLGGEPATTYIRRALGRAINVVTANKGPLAFAYHELKALAAGHGAAFRFESAVMDGAPVFNLVERCLPAVKVTGFKAILNSTTNLILTGMEQGRSFDEALAEARSIGVAEANSDYDIDGWDAAVKSVALANVLMGADARPRDVERRGIRDITCDEVRAAVRDGCAIRLIARADSTGRDLRLRVAPERVPAASLMASARGTSNVLVIDTDLMGRLSVFETAPGVEQTAYGLLSDMIRIHESMPPRLNSRASN